MLEVIVGVMKSDWASMGRNGEVGTMESDWAAIRRDGEVGVMGSGGEVGAMGE